MRCGCAEKSIAAAVLLLFLTFSVCREREFTVASPKHPHFDAEGGGGRISPEHPHEIETPITQQHSLAITQRPAYDVMHLLTSSILLHHPSLSPKESIRPSSSAPSTLQ